MTVCPSVIPSFHPFVSRIMLILLVPYSEKIQHLGDLCNLDPFQFSASFTSSSGYKKIINDPHWPIDFLLGVAQNFQIGGGMHSPSSAPVTLRCTIEY